LGYYPRRNINSLKINFPKEWRVKHFEHFLEARSVEDSLQFILLKFNPGHNLESAKTFLAGFLEDLAPDIQLVKNETLLFNEITFKSFRGSGKISETSKYLVTTFIFNLSNEQYFGIITIYPREFSESVEGKIREVLGSLRKI
jgi:archaellum biogenesis ATPase FlaH